MSKFIQELKRRNVIKAAISYVVIGWAILQVSDILLPAFKLPEESIRFILYALIAGFPIWLIFAYIFEWTPSGFKRTVEVTEEQSVHKQTSQRLNYFIIGGMAIAIILLVSDRLFNFTGTEEVINKAKSIAVLPFENMSSEEDAYFAMGVTQDILTQVSKIGDLRVLSNFTLRDYDIKGKTLEEIGNELEVEYLLTGSIRRAGEQLRINCELIQINPEEQAWSENFDKRMDDVFAIQAQIAEEVALNLQTTLNPEEKAKLSLIPTKNIAAYNIYLKGREEYNKYEKESIEQAIELFKEAIAMDENFGLAYAGLADAYALGVSNYLFLSDNYLDSAEQIAQKATILSPNLPEPWKALGVILSFKGDYITAKEKYQKALQQDPNHFPAIANLGLNASDQGQLDEAVAAYKKVIQLSPLSFLAYSNLGSVYHILDMPKKASEVLQKSLTLKPNNFSALYFSACSYADYRDTTMLKLYCEKLLNLGSEDLLINMLVGELALWYDTAFAKICMKKVVTSEVFDSTYISPVASTLGYLLWEEGKKDSALSWLEPGRIAYEKALKEGRVDLEMLEGMFWNYAIRGENKKALDLLEEVQKIGDEKPPLEYTTDPRFKNLLQEPRFRAIMEEKQQKINTMRLRVQQQELEELSQ